MAIINIPTKDFVLFGDGGYAIDDSTYRIRQYNYGGTGSITLTVENVNDDTTNPLAGTIAFSVGVEIGENNTMDISSERVRLLNGRPAFFDVNFTGISSDSKFLLHIR